MAKSDGDSAVRRGLALSPGIDLEEQPPWWMVRVASTVEGKDRNQFERRVLEVVGLDPRGVFVGQELDGGWTVKSLSRVADGLTVTLRRNPEPASVPEA